MKDPEKIGCRSFGKFPSSKHQKDGKDICPGPECSAFLECLEETLWYVDRKLGNAMDFEESELEIDKEKISNKFAEILNDIEYLSMHGPLKFADEDISEIAKLKETMVEGMADGMILLNGTGRPMVYNLLGIKLYQDICTCHEDLIGGSCPVHACLEQIISEDMEITLQELIKNEKVYEMRFSKVLLSTRKEHGAVVIIRDVTKEKLVQQQILQSSKMAAIGELAAGIAHEINNPLTAVIGFSELWLIKGVDDDKLRSDLGKIHEAGLKAAEIVKDLLCFSKDQKRIEKGPMLLNEAVESSLKLIRSYYEKENINLDEDLTSGLPHILGNLGQIQQVVLNLVSNARDAILESGRGGGIEVLTRGLDGRVVLEVSDNGPGIPDEIQDKIFEPFYTTKPPGKGTGLGLFIAYSIIKEHNGKISLRSQEGETTFIVELPVMADVIDNGSNETESQKTSSRFL